VLIQRCQSHSAYDRINTIQDISDIILFYKESYFLKKFVLTAAHGGV